MRTESHKRYAERNKERLAREQHVYRQREEYKTARRLRDAATQNERNNRLGWRLLRYREMQKQKLTFDYDQLSIVPKVAIANPVFIVVCRGERRRETLFEPLPTWEAE